MQKAKLSDLWLEVDKALSGERAAGIKLAIIEAHKILEATLDSKGYPGSNVKKKLYWAGYSLADKEGILSALELREKIVNNFDYQLSDLEAEETVKLYKKVVQEIVKKEEYGFADKIRAFYQMHLHPKSVYFWRNFGLIFGTLAFIKILKYASFGKSLVDFFVSVADFVVSFPFLIILVVIAIIIVLVTNYFANKNRVKIKPDSY